MLEIFGINITTKPFNVNFFLFQKKKIPKKSTNKKNKIKFLVYKCYVHGHLTIDFIIYPGLL